jgi:hypothetical protein
MDHIVRCYRKFIPHFPGVKQDENYTVFNDFLFFKIVRGARHLKNRRKQCL